MSRRKSGRKLNKMGLALRLRERIVRNHRKERDKMKGKRKKMAGKMKKLILFLKMELDFKI